MAGWILLWAMLGAPVAAADALSLDDAMALAAETGPAAKRARLSLETALERVAHERPVLRPDLTITGSGQALTPTVRDPAAPNALVRGSLVGRVELRARQTIYHAGGGALDRRADAAVAAAVAEHAAALLAVRREAALAWLDLAAARAAVAVAEEGLRQAEAQLRRVEELLAVEKVAETDRLQAEAGVLEAKAGLAEAQNGAALAVAALNRVLGRPLDTPCEPTTLPEPATLPDLATAVAWAQEHRPELTALRARVAEAEAGGAFARAERLPTLALTGLVAAQTAEAFHRGAEAGVGVELSLPLTRADDEPSRREREARAGAAQAALALAELRDGIALQVRRAHGDFATAWARRDLAEARVRALAEAHRVKLLQYERARTTLLEVQAALAALGRARLDAALARIDLERAVVEFTAATAREPAAW